MSKLDDLIREKCSDGVEYRELGQICDMARGTSATKGSLSVGEIPVISGGKEPSFYCDVANREGETITVAGSGAGAGYLQYWEEPIFVNDAFSIKGKDGIDTKYIYYVLANKQEQIYATKKGGGVPHVHISSISSFKIPVPPLEVQGEIVRILDNFAELTAELTAELDKRKKQYEYYRDLLLTFDEAGSAESRERIRWLTVSECCNILDSKRRPVSKSERNSGEYPYYGANGVQDWVSDYIFDGTYILVGEDGSVIDENNKPIVNWAEGKIWVNNHAHIVSEKSGVLLRYLYYFMQTINVRDLIHGNIPKLNQSDFRNIKIAVPSIEEQEKIVLTLDKFNALCESITSGLPAEIAARQKQYEYYRDKLLTFKELRNEQI